MRKKDLKIKKNIEIESLLTKFMPRFGNEYDITISREYTEALRLRTKIANHYARIEELKRVTKTFNDDARRLELVENNLLMLLKDRRV